jgi:hypothetical protein
MVRDSEFVAFITWLYPKSAQTDEAGALARHVLANAFFPSVFTDPAALKADLQGNVSYASESAPDHKIPLQKDVGFVPTLGNCQSALAAAPIDQLKWSSIDALKTSILHFGPNVTLTQFNTALAAFRGS